MRPVRLLFVALPAVLFVELLSGFVFAPRATSPAEAGDGACCENCQCVSDLAGIEEPQLFVFQIGTSQTVFRMEGDEPIHFAIKVFNEEESSGWVNLEVDRLAGSGRPDVRDVNWIRAGQSAEIVATLERGDEVQLAAPLGSGTRAWWSIVPIGRGESR